MYIYIYIYIYRYTCCVQICKCLIMFSIEGHFLTAEAAHRCGRSLIGRPFRVPEQGRPLDSQTRGPMRVSD